MDVDPSAVTAALPGSGDGGGDASARPDETVGKYRLDRELGRGGMGVVWAAFDPDLERAVALKLLRTEAADSSAMRTRLLREARAMAKLRHPNVVTVFDVGTDKGRDFIAMELVDGGTLDDWLQTKPPREVVVDALLAAGRGLAAAHAKGLVHRDFKPHNVLRGSDGHVYVTDFGLARGQIEDGPEIVTSSDNLLDSPLTQTGVLVGTPAYMAPEQFAGAVPDPKSDQFAFCVTMWQALTGERPFRGSSVEELAASARAGTATLAADLPAALRSVLTRGLSPSPADRWPDMPALLAALTDALADERGPRQHWARALQQTEQALADRRPRRRWFVPALVAGLLATTGVGAFTVISLRGGSSDPCDTPADEAFAKVWNADARRSLESRGFAAAGATELMGEIRRAWTASYTAACEAPRTAETEERVRCLLDSRDEFGRTLRSFAGKPNDQAVALIAASMVRLVSCDPTILNDMRDRTRDRPPRPPFFPRRP